MVPTFDDFILYHKIKIPIDFIEPLVFQKSNSSHLNKYSKKFRD